MTLRERYYLFASGAFIVLGSVILVRAVLAGVFVVGILGIVLIALGLVRVRDLLVWRGRSGDS